MRTFKSVIRQKEEINRRSSQKCVQRIQRYDRQQSQHQKGPTLAQLMQHFIKFPSDDFTLNFCRNNQLLDSRNINQQLTINGKNNIDNTHHFDPPRFGRKQSTQSNDRTLKKPQPSHSNYPAKNQLLGVFHEQYKKKQQFTLDKNSLKQSDILLQSNLQCEIVYEEVQKPQIINSQVINSGVRNSGVRNSRQVIHKQNDNFFKKVLELKNRHKIEKQHLSVNQAGFKEDLKNQIESTNKNLDTKIGGVAVKISQAKAEIANYLRKYEKNTNKKDQQIKLQSVSKRNKKEIMLVGISQVLSEQYDSKAQLFNSVQGQSQLSIQAAEYQIAQFTSNNNSTLKNLPSKNLGSSIKQRSFSKQTMLKIVQPLQIIQNKCIYTTNNEREQVHNQKQNTLRPNIQNNHHKAQNDKAQNDVIKITQSSNFVFDFDVKIDPEY